MPRPVIVAAPARPNGHQPCAWADRRVVDLAHWSRRGEFAAAIVAVGPHQLAATVGEAEARTRGARRSRRSARSPTNRSRRSILVRRADRLRRADAPTRRRAGPMGVRPQRRTRSARGGGAQPDRRRDQRRRPARRARSRDARGAGRRAAATARPGAAAPLLVRDRRAARNVCLHTGARAPGWRTHRSRRLPRRRLHRREFPPTLEAATRSGVAAARALIADGATGAAARGSTRAP